MDAKFEQRLVSVSPAEIIISALSKAYHSHPVSTGKWCHLICRKANVSMWYLQTEGTKQGIEKQFVQKASYTKHGQNQNLIEVQRGRFCWVKND